MGMWMGGKRKEVGGWGRNFCSRWYRDTKQSTYTCMCVRVCVCVHGTGQLVLPHFSQMGFSYNSAKQSLENPLEKVLPIIPL